MKYSSIFYCTIFFINLGYAASSQNGLPINITSQSATADLQQGIVIYNGNVLATQGTRKLQGNILIIKRGSDGRIQSFMAEGMPAKTEEQSSPSAAIAYGQAEKIYYFPEQNIIKYMNNARFTQNGNVFAGALITYNTVTQVVSTPRTENGKDVTTIILPAYEQKGNSNS